MDVDARSDLPFPRSLPELQRLFPDYPACADWLKKQNFTQANSLTLPYLVRVGEKRIGTEETLLALTDSRFLVKWREG